MERTPYPTDVSDAEWAFVAPYLTLSTADAPQRIFALRESFNGLRPLLHAGATWPLLPHDLPPWWIVYGQTHRRPAAGVFGRLVDRWWALLHVALGRAPAPSAAIFDSRMLQSTPESAPARAMTAAKAATAARCIWPWTRWGTC